MVYSTCFVSLMMIISIFLYSSTIATSLRGHSTPIKSHNADLVIDDGIVARNHFADFLRALYAPQATKDHLAMEAENDMPNDIFPLTPVGEEHDIHDEDYDRDQTRQNEFPVDGVLLPILQKRNARYCGSFLADALQLACSRGLLNGKRSTSAQDNALSTTTAATPNTEFRSWPFINSDKAHSMLSNQHLFHRYTRGVHDECCVKGCSFRELKSYCSSS